MKKRNVQGSDGGINENIKIKEERAKIIEKATKKIHEIISHGSCTWKSITDNNNIMKAFFRRSSVFLTAQISPVAVVLASGSSRCFPRVLPLFREIVNTKYIKNESLGGWPRRCNYFTDKNSLHHHVTIDESLVGFLYC